MVSKEVLKKRYIICPFLPSKDILTHHSFKDSRGISHALPQRTTRISPERIKAFKVLLGLPVISLISFTENVNRFFHLEAFRKFSISALASRK